jgi:spore coat protein A
VVPSVHPHWVPEFFGDVAVVNAKITPFAAVEPRRYRLRIVNGSQARFYHLKFTNTRNGKIHRFHQIGTDGGLLRAPVAMRSLLLAPGERADVIIDFGGLAGARIELKNDAKAPYPMGPGGGVVHLMAFNVTKPLNGTDTTTPAARLQLPNIPALPEPSVTRVQHLSETLDPMTGAPIHLNVEDKPYLDAAGPARCHDEAAGRGSRGLAAGQHDRRHAPDPPTPRDLRGQGPQAVRRRGLHPRRPHRLHRRGGPSAAE